MNQPTERKGFGKAVGVLALLAAIPVPLVAVMLYMQGKARPELPVKDLPKVAEPADAAKQEFQSQLDKAYRAAHQTGAGREQFGALLEKQMRAAQFFADYQPLVESYKELQQGLQDSADPVEALLLADTLVALNEYGEAQRVINQLRDDPTLRSGVQFVQSKIDLHLKRKLDHWAGRLQQNTAIKAGQWHAWVKYGKALRLSGKLAAADVAFERAVQEYQGNSPFDLAEIFYERSLGWLAGPEPDHRQARRYLEFAVSYLPGYVDAHLQLARVYLHLHYKGSARTLLEAIKDGPDPRAAAMLAGLYEKAGDDPLAKASLNAAKDKYEKVLETVPYVASDHAVDFFLELGEDPARALELAEMNLRVRPTLVAFEKAIAAAKQAADTTALCRIVDELQNRFPNAKLVGMVACS